MKTKARLLERLMLLMLALCLTAACSDKNEDEPAGPDNPSGPTTPTGDEFTVAATGGTVEKGDIAITFPSGTFTGETKVYVKEVTKGEIRSEDEVSTFYQVTMPVDSRQPVTVSIKANGGDGDIVMLARSQGMDLHTWEEGTYDITLDCTHSGDTYTATIPAFDNEGESGTENITLGLVLSPQANTANARSADTRASSNDKEDGTITYRFDWGSRKDAQKYANLELDIRSYLDEAISKIKALGFKVKGDRTMPVIIAEPSESSIMQNHFNRSKPGEWGRCVASSSGNKWNCLILNRPMMLGLTEPTELRKTVIHEMFHYFQFEHDPRSAWDRTHASGKNVEYQMLIESGGAWAESLLGFGPSAVMIDNAGQALYSFNRIVKERHKNEEGKYVGDADACTNLGYGLATVLYYICGHTGNAKILDLYKYWKSHSGKKFDEYIVSWSSAAGHDFKEHYEDYAYSLLSGQLISDLSFPKLKAEDVTVAITTPESYQIKNVAYKYGSSVRHYGIDRRYKNSRGEASLVGDTLRFKHNASGVISYVYYVNNENKSGKLLGTSYKDNPLDITDPAILNWCIEKNAVASYYVVTQQTSNISAETNFEMSIDIIEGAQLNLSPDSLGFGATSDTKTISVETNVESITVTPSASWISARYIKNSKQIEVSVEANTGKQREGTISVKAGKTEKTVKLTQAAAKGDFDFSKCIAVRVTIKANVHTESNVEGQTGNGMYSYEFWPTSARYREYWNTTSTPNGNGMHIVSHFRRNYNGDFVATDVLTVEMDIDNVVDGHITNCTITYNYDDVSGSPIWHISASASNIPLPNSSGRTKGNKSTGTSINSFSYSEKNGWVERTRSLVGSSDDEISIEFVTGGLY